MYIISACLLGENCKYKGGNNFCPAAARFARAHRVFSVCPEAQGGQPTPRPPAEIRGGRVINREGKDMTESFERGARECLALAKAAAKELGEPIEGAILKAHSPSCGRDQIYDGTFSGRLTEGDGFFARLLKKESIRVITEKEIESK